MKPRPTPLRSQQGVAVVTALLLTTLSITIVASLFWEQQVQVRSIENQRLQLQKQWVLRGALDWAALILREDARNSSVDDLTEPWAVPLAETRLDQYVENGQADGDVAGATLSGGITDAQARYNLTNLVQNGNIKPTEVAVFARLLSNAKLDPALAQATADLMAATQTTPGPESVGGQPAPRPMKLSQVEDLLAVPGFTPEILEQIKGFVIFLPNQTPVNVNTAPAEVLAATIGFSLSEAAALVASRDTASFRNFGDFTNRLPGRAISFSSTDVSVTTNYFLVNGKVRMSRASLEVQALIDRTSGSTGFPEIIQISEY